MEDVVVCEALEKSYPLGLGGLARVRDVLQPDRNARRFTALKNVSFALKAGETLGVLGVNGAGKSTLLKLIAGVSAPTAGRVETRGRVGAILELGAGFLGEYTGRQNARMSLALSGLKGAALDDAADKAAEFAGIGEFFDAPVRVYSSGMFVRLAFACATAVQPDLLLVDEALSVGDLRFQAKCVQKMRAMLQAGSALVFVSHDLSAIKSLCERCLLLNGGQMQALGPPDEVAETYCRLLEAGRQTAPMPNAPTDGQEAGGKARFVGATLRAMGSEAPAASLAFGEEALLEAEIECLADIPALVAGYHIQDGAGVDAVYCDTAISGERIEGLRAGERLKLQWRFAALLNEGPHNVVLSAAEPVDLEHGLARPLCRLPRAAQFFVERRPGAKLHGLTTWNTEVAVCRSR